MDHYIDFTIPLNKEELVSNSSTYTVDNVIEPKDLGKRLKETREDLRNNGIEFIMENFNVFFSVLYNSDSTNNDIIFESYEILQRASNDLRKTLNFLLEDEQSLDEDLKRKYLTIIKMFFYLFTQIIQLIEQKNEKRNHNLGKGRKKKTVSDDEYLVDKKKVILTMNDTIDMNISVFWNPPVVEESLVRLISDQCYHFLKDPSIKKDKDLCLEIFSLIGKLIKNHKHGFAFVLRAVELLKTHEHMVTCLAEGIKNLVGIFDCKGLVRDLIKEIMESLTDDKYQDSQGSKFCCMILSELAVVMPNDMLEQLSHLVIYLDHENFSIRIAVLCTITEVLINLKHVSELTEEEKEYHDSFMNQLAIYIRDISAHVRAKVLQQWTKLQNAGIVPVEFQLNVLKKAVGRLADKSSSVRKAALNLVTVLLASNPYGAELSLSKVKVTHEEKKEALENFKKRLHLQVIPIVSELQSKWDLFKDELKEIILEGVENDKEKDDQEDKNNDEDKENVEDKENESPPDPPLEEGSFHELIRIYLNNDQCKDAFDLCRKFIKSNEEIIKKFDHNLGESKEEDAAFYFYFLLTIFVGGKDTDDLESMDIQTIIAKSATPAENLKLFEELEKEKTFYDSYVQFLELIGKSFNSAVEMLESAAISEMQEAANYFVAVNQFNFDNASVGIIEMFKIMNRNEEDRVNIVVNAFKTLYLVTDSKDLDEHCSQIVSRLMRLVKTLPAVRERELQLIIAAWTERGILDNSIIDVLWKFFTKKLSVTDEDSVAALKLLRMCSTGRRTIITKNVKVVTSIAFGERGQSDLLLLGNACEFLAVLGADKINITSDRCPFRINAEDEMFEKLSAVLYDKFFVRCSFYRYALNEAINFIFKVCAKPFQICEELLAKVWREHCARQRDNDQLKLEKHVLIRMCQLLGSIAINLVEFLDESVYKELKRREHIRGLKKEAKKGKNGRSKRNSRKSTATSASTAMNEIMNASQLDESVMEGAQAEDTDAEFILNLLEHHTVTKSSPLGSFAAMITNICMRPHLYKSVEVQNFAHIALLRYMLVSSIFCKKHIQLIFTILEKTEHNQIKLTILIHLSDLTMRFPNILDPWVPCIFNRLNDSNEDIRKMTFYVLSNLILKDMVRAHTNMHKMSVCLVDENEEIKKMCQTFFNAMAQKDKFFYNNLPDIFSFLVSSEKLSDDDVRLIIKFLFQKVDKSNQMESLVDRYCEKFGQSDDLRQHRLISFCLTLVQYNERSLEKLIEKFPRYKNTLRDEHIYASFKTIMQACNKQKVGKVCLKDLVGILEQNITSIFKLNEDETSMRPPPLPKSTKKTTKRKRIKSRKVSDEDDEDFDVSSNLSCDTPRKSSRLRRN